MNKIICIAGDSSTGKSFLANYIFSNLEDCLIYDCDRYHLYERNNIIWKTYTQLNPEYNNLDLLKKDLLNLKNNNKIYSREYDHTNGKFTVEKLVIPKKYIIVTGLHTLYDNIIKLSDYNIYIDVDNNLKDKWKYNRDISSRNYNKDECLKQINRRKIDFKKYIEMQIKKADYILNINSNNINNITEYYNEIIDKIK